MEGRSRLKGDAGRWLARSSLPPGQQVRHDRGSGRVRAKARFI